MSDKPKYPYATALAVALELVNRLKPYCGRIEIAGSLRRKKREVGDVEILYVPTFTQIAASLFGDVENVPDTEEIIDHMTEDGTLVMRPNKAGAFAWGPKNKLAIHVPTGIPVDLFATSEDCWWNALVCRTGGLENNLKITQAAQRQGWSFEAYGSGFRKPAKGLGKGEHYQTTSEEDVYKFLGLPYLQPDERP
jgi:DNA polymerase/3'-5' exonuclease PolX